ncbi:MAG: NAD(P)(+) transhydrogenase (Re/Si-specific) subunit beta, partial [Chitinophagaceae bacterium]
MELNVLTLCYLIGSVTFILGLKMLSNPATARNGNLLAAAGMTIAILGTIFLYEEGGQKLGNYAWIFGGILIGGIIGTLSARRVKMTAMPEMVSMFNGMGGACAALISIVEFNHGIHPTVVSETFVGEMGQGSYIGIALPSAGFLLIICLGLIIGSVSFA